MPQAQQRLMVMVRISASVAVRTWTNANFFKPLYRRDEIVWMVTDQLVERRMVEHIAPRVVLLRRIKCRLQSIPQH